jgi:hypothetical protein
MIVGPPHKVQSKGESLNAPEMITIGDIHLTTVIKTKKGMVPIYVALGLWRAFQQI